jgi:hypothetical protein
MDKSKEKEQVIIEYLAGGTTTSQGGSLSLQCSLSGYSRQTYYKQTPSFERGKAFEGRAFYSTGKTGYRQLQKKRIGGKKLFFLAGLWNYMILVWAEMPFVKCSGSMVR